MGTGIYGLFEGLARRCSARGARESRYAVVSTGGRLVGILETLEGVTTGPGTPKLVSCGRVGVRLARKLSNLLHGFDVGKRNRGGSRLIGEDDRHESGILEAHAGSEYAHDHVVGG